MTTLAPSPDEWKCLCLNNVSQLGTFINSIPAIAADNTGAGLTDAHLDLVQSHLNRFNAFMNAWRRSRVAGTVAQPSQAASPTNGEQSPEPVKAKRKGGWPAGKSRKPKPAEAVQ